MARFWLANLNYRFALRADFSAKQLRQPTADDQAKACAFVKPRQSGIDLLEWLE